jgi:epoxyqueuosine reductase
MRQTAEEAANPWAVLADQVKDWGRDLGFAELRIGTIDLTDAGAGLDAWLDAGFQGAMDYMARHRALRANPRLLAPGALRVISARMNYLPRNSPDDWREREQRLTQQPDHAVVALYARGRDYHKVLRQRLGALGTRLGEAVQHEPYRPYCDSAPVLEVALATQAGLGWRGKNTLLLSREGGSMVFLGELLTDLPLAIDPPVSDHCGTCTACLDVCPTRAIVAPYVLDARRCISYLTIEHPGSIPESLRPLIGNRVYGCDDCQWVCPWNRFAVRASLPDFDVRHGLDDIRLTDLAHWTQTQFLERTEGSPIRRIGFERWSRNLAVALGNAPSTPAVRQALGVLAAQSSELVREHVQWAMARHG